NVAKHADATTTSVSLTWRGAPRSGSGRLIAEVTDDGVGGADPQAGTGMLGLADRLAVVDGRMYVSSPLGGPTVVRFEVPCQPLTSPRAPPSSPRTRCCAAPAGRVRLPGSGTAWPPRSATPP